MSQISPLERVALDEENPWNIAEAHYPALGSVPEQLRFLLGYAILAPSRSNSQPWQFHLVEDTAEIWLDPLRSLPVADSRGREMYISCGTALLFLRIAAQYFGHTTQVELLPNLEQEGLLARVR